MVTVSVVIPVHDGAATIGACLTALLGQSLDRSRYEIIVADDGSADGTGEIVRSYPVKLLRSETNRGSPAARNMAIAAATGDWVAFTDADCVPSRSWLASLLRAIESDPSPETVAGIAGKIMGFPSEASAARFASLTGHLDTERQLNHPTYPYAYMASVMYRRAAIEAAGPFDESMRIYATPEFHHRVITRFGGRMLYEPRAVVLHRHPETWGRYWRQQWGYGAGYATFLRRHRDRFPWSAASELRAWASLLVWTAAACLPGRSDRALIRRGMAVKQLAQRVGFLRTYYGPRP